MAHKKPGAIGWGKSAKANGQKSGAHRSHKMKMAKPMKAHVSKKGTSVGNLSGVGVRGWVNA